MEFFLKFVWASVWRIQWHCDRLWQCLFSLQTPPPKAVKKATPAKATKATPAIKNGAAAKKAESEDDDDEEDSG